MKKIETSNNEIYIITKGVLLDVFSKSPFLSKKPNSNNQIEDALAILTMASAKLFLSIKREIDDNEFEIAAIILRTLLEVNANIAYLCRNTDKSKLLAGKFLKTAYSMLDKLISINGKRKFIESYWTDTSISKRIKMLGNNRLIEYKLLCSYAHVDAGFMSAYFYQYRDYLGSLLFLISQEFMWDIVDNLEQYGVINDKVLTESILRQIKDSTPELKARFIDFMRKNTKIKYTSKN